MAGRTANWPENEPARVPSSGRLPATMRQIRARCRPGVRSPGWPGQSWIQPGDTSFPSTAAEARVAPSASAFINRCSVGGGDRRELHLAGQATAQALVASGPRQKRAELGQLGSQHHRILDGLIGALAVVRLSSAWAASPSRLTRPRVQRPSGGRWNKAQRWLVGTAEIICTTAGCQLAKQRASRLLRPVTHSRTGHGEGLRSTSSCDRPLADGVMQQVATRPRQNWIASGSGS